MHVVYIGIYDILGIVSKRIYWAKASFARHSASSLSILQEVAFPY